MAVGGPGRLTGLSWAHSIIAPHGGAAQSSSSYGDQSTSKRFTPPVERGLPLLRARMSLTHDFTPAVPVVLKSESPGLWVEGAALRRMLVSGVPPSGWRGNVAHIEQVMEFDAASSSPESHRQPVSVGLGLGSSPRRVQSAFERDPPLLGPRQASTSGLQGIRCAHRASNSYPCALPSGPAARLHALTDRLFNLLVRRGRRRSRRRHPCHHHRRRRRRRRHLRRGKSD